MSPSLFYSLQNRLSSGKLTTSFLQLNSSHCIVTFCFAPSLCHLPAPQGRTMIWLFGSFLLPPSSLPSSTISRAVSRVKVIRQQAVAPMIRVGSHNLGCCTWLHLLTEVSRIFPRQRIFSACVIGIETSVSAQFSNPHWAQIFKFSLMNEHNSSAASKIQQLRLEGPSSNNDAASAIDDRASIFDAIWSFQTCPTASSSGTPQGVSSLQCS